MQSDVPNLKQKPDEVLNVHIYEGADYQTEYYEDDGETFSYSAGAFFRRVVRHEHKERNLTFEAAEGAYASHFKRMRIFFHGFQNYSNAVRLNGKPLEIVQEHISFVDPLSDFDPYHKPPKDRVLIMDINTVEVPNASEAFTISWG
jgi:alpha-glucosidase